MTISTLTLNDTQAKSLVSLISLADTSRGSTAPILGVIRVVVAGHSVKAYATDRYVAGMAEITLEDSANDEFEFFLNADSAKFIKAIKGAFYATFTLGDSGIEIRANSASITVAQPAGKYPPIHQFIEEFQPTETGALSLALEKIAQVQKTQPINGLNSWHVEFSSGSNNKPGPVRFTNGNITVLVQPNLLKR